MKVSVVIPTYRHEARLRRTIEDTLALDWPDDEVMVVDPTERPEPDTGQLLARVGDRIEGRRHAPKRSE